MSAAQLSPAMMEVLAALSAGGSVDGRSWRAVESLKRRGLLAAGACFHPLSCMRCRTLGWACRAHVAGQRGHERCSGNSVMLGVTDAGHEAARA